jgi:isopentenyl diphosphate isomerase/L-lactate dehydrogenase-like FMN-dependent dehydrogenase
VVSNHGGRQLDTAVSSIAALPRVVDAVGDNGVVLIDGGVRRGSDVAKALALGAQACLIARPYLYGLSVRGADGVEAVVNGYQRELARVLALAGCPVVKDLSREWLWTGGCPPLSDGSRC